MFGLFNGGPQAPALSACAFFALAEVIEISGLGNRGITMVYAAEDNKR
jgi:hypothetical protein